jgi:hypothetical protein
MDTDQAIYRAVESPVAWTIVYWVMVTGQMATGLLYLLATGDRKFKWHVEVLAARKTDRDKHKRRRLRVRCSRLDGCRSSGLFPQNQAGASTLRDSLGNDVDSFHGEN